MRIPTLLKATPPQRVRTALRISLFMSAILSLVFVSTDVTSAHIERLIPNSIVAGGGDFELRILGTDFNESDVELVTFAGVPVAASLISPQEMQATIPAALIATPGTVGVSLAGEDSIEFTITSGCLYEITVGSGTQKLIGLTFSADGGSGVANIGTQPGCKWSAKLTEGAAFVSLTGVSSESDGQLVSQTLATGTGKGAITYSIKPNPTAGFRSAVIRLFASDLSTLISAEPFTVGQMGTGCPASAFKIETFETVFDRAGGRSHFFVTAPPNCSWEATSDQSWLTMHPFIVLGSANIEFTVPPNDAGMRSALVTAADKSFAVMQLPDECFLEMLCAFVPSCGEGSASPIPTARKFRDAVLARTERGKRYTNLYYQLSSEAIQAGILHPTLMLRSREIFDRYKPVLETMSRGEQVTLTEGDVDDIDDFIQTFSANSSSRLRETLNDLRRDLRDPQVHREFNISVVKGPKRTTARAVGIGERSMKLSIGIGLALFLLAGSGRRTIRRHQSRGTLLGLLIGCFTVACFYTLTLHQTNASTSAAGLKTDPAVTDFCRGIFGTRRLRSLRDWRPTRTTSSSFAVTRSSFRSARTRSDIVPQELSPQAGNNRLAFSTYFGGSGDEEGSSIALDSAGNIYLAGFTDSANFPLVNAAQTHIGGEQDAFVTKLDPTGSRIIYSTYIGGNHQDNATSIAVDSSGNAYITGFTSSTNFPVKNAIQANNKGEFNAFVVKLDPAGAILNSTLFGGTLADYGAGIAVDSAGKVYIAGIATSTDFPVSNAAQVFTGGLSDGYVAKIDLGTGTISYSTYLGGAGTEGATSIAVDSAGSAYVTGLTSSPNFPTLNPFRSHSAGGVLDAFVTKLSPTGALAYSTYLGGSGEDRAFRIAVDSGGNAYVTGDTDSPNFPTNSSAPALPEAAAFVSKLNPSGNQLVYSRLISGNALDGGTSIAVDSAGSAYVAGFTTSTNFPSINSIQQASAGKYDGFVVRLSVDGSTLEYSTYLGGGEVDSVFGVAANSSGAYIMGVTNSTNFPTAGPLQAVSGGGKDDLFIAKITGGPFIATITPDGKRLLVSGSGFDAGAKILVNGEKQKTTNDAQNPGGLLAGKKANKLIPRGTTVNIQVKNADGSLSNEVPYTRL